MKPTPNLLRGAFILIGVLILTLGLGYIFNTPWAMATWPWPDTPLSYLFIGSILAAVAAAFLWIGWSTEWGAAVAGAITEVVTATGQAGFLFLLAVQTQPPGVLVEAVWFAFVALASGGLLLWSRRFPIRDRRPMPRLLRVSFVVFVVVLVLAGGALVLGTQIFPWKLHPNSAVMYGWIFLGDACYFLYSLTNPLWHNARAQLLSFVAYDVVLIPRFVGLFTVPTTNQLSLTVYLLVLFYSLGLGVYYLLLDPVTRVWGIQEVVPAS